MINPKEMATGQIDFVGPIVLHVGDRHCYGDVSMAVKICRFLLNKYPNTTIYVIGNNKSFAKIKDIIPEFLNQSIYPQIQIIYSNQLNFMKNFFGRVQLEIETSIFNNALNISQSDVPHPKIFIGEYGFYEKNPYDASVMFISGSIGDKPSILIEAELVAFSHLTCTEKEKARVKILEELGDPLLKKQILSKKMTKPKQFIKKNNFAFSYYNLQLSHKRAAIVFAANNTKQHANYIVSASDEKMIVNLFHDSDFTDEIKRLKYYRLVYYDINSEQPSQQLIFEDNKAGNREFRIFHRSIFSHNLALDLMRLSDLCGTAGDQLLTEAISLGIVPIPEECRFQFNLIDQLAQIYYANTIMARFYNRTWRRQRKTDIELWEAAGELLHEEPAEIAAVFKKIQQESNLYKILDQQLDLVFLK